MLIATQIDYIYTWGRNHFGGCNYGNFYTGFIICTGDVPSCLVNTNKEQSQKRKRNYKYSFVSTFWSFACYGSF
jgi:hypothetical protein